MFLLVDKNKTQYYFNNLFPLKGAIQLDSKVYGLQEPDLIFSFFLFFNMFVFWEKEEGREI